MQRRHFLKNTMATGAIALAASSGLLVPGSVLAAWNKKAFDAKDVQSALKLRRLRLQKTVPLYLLLSALL